MFLPAFVALLAATAATQDVAVETQPDGRMRLTVVFATANPEMYARAMLRLRETAVRRCQGRGRPVSIGPLEANQVPHRRGRLSLTETYSCGPPTAN